MSHAASTAGRRALTSSRPAGQAALHLCGALEAVARRPGPVFACEGRLQGRAVHIHRPSAWQAFRRFSAGNSSGSTSGQGQKGEPKESGEKSEASGEHQGRGEESESDRRHADTGEYDTQERYKRIGNPIQWANPMGGGSQMEDNSSKHWRWVFPAGVSFILLLALWSRTRNVRKEQEEEVIASMKVQRPDLQSFSTPAYRPPEPAGRDDEDEEMPPPSAAIGGNFDFSGGSGSFSTPPPSSGQRSNW